MKQIVLFFSLITSIFCFGQSTTLITYKWNSRYNEKILNMFPASARAAIQKNNESIKFVATLNFDPYKSYFVSHEQNTNIEDNPTSQNFDKRSSGALISSKYTGDKYCINFKKNTITELKKGKAITTLLKKSNWKLTKKTKKILGYICFEAIDKNSNSNMTVYYTTEIKGQAIPLQMSFPDGVVLEYSSDNKYGIATSVLLNQPEIVDFFKNK